MLLSIVLVPAGATAQYASPDPKTVSSVSEAAKFCGFDRVGVVWKETGEKTLDMTLREADLVPESPVAIPLKGCFFPWAYARDVKINLSVESNSAK